MASQIQVLADDAEGMIQDTIVKEMRLAAQAAGMPTGFVENIRLRRVSDTQYVIENDWHKEDKYGRHPLARFFEYGTKSRIWIEPREPGGVLAWGHPGHGAELHGIAIYFEQSATSMGDSKFSKGHYVSGLRALMPMHNGFQIGVKEMRERLRTRQINMSRSGSQQERPDPLGLMQDILEQKAAQDEMIDADEYESGMYDPYYDEWAEDEFEDEDDDDYYPSSYSR